MSYKYKENQGNDISERINQQKTEGTEYTNKRTDVLRLRGRNAYQAATDLLFAFSAVLSYGLCEKYEGDACREFLGNKTIWMNYHGHQEVVEYQMAQGLTAIKEAEQLSDR